MQFIIDVFKKDEYESDFSYICHTLFLQVASSCVGIALWAITRVFSH